MIRNNPEKNLYPVAGAESAIVCSDEIEFESVPTVGLLGEQLRGSHGGLFFASMNHEYRKEYRETEREAIWTGWRIILAIIVLGIIITAAKFVFWPVKMAGRTLDSAERVIDKELMPEALNQKYNWLKDQASAIRAQKAKIDLMRGNFTTAMTRAEGRQLSHTAEERLFTQEQDLQNTILAYNTLVGTYNGEMSKWHTAFVNVGAMPQGWQDVAPAKFPEYINQ